jgi:protein SCO1/2
MKPTALHHPGHWSLVILWSLVVGHWSLAQIPSPSSEVLKQVGINQNLNTQLPLDLTFKDETGKTVQLRDYFNNNKPAVLSLVYYNCPMLCTMTLNGESAAFKPLSLEIGTDFNVITVSFDPRETPELAAQKKSVYLKELNRPGAATGWHFLTGDEQNISQLAQSVGFKYYYDKSSNQFAHASAIIVLTPGGKISRYFQGLEYSPKDLRLSLIEASNNQIGSKTDQLLLLCYQYDPTTGRYGLAIMRAVRVGGIITFILLTTFIVRALRKEQIANRKLQIANQP